MGLADILGGKSPDGLTITIILGALLLALYWRVFTLRLDPREPPILKPRIPVIGHILGLIQESHGYWPKLYKSAPGPAYTLPMLNGKMYIINDPSLISAAFRARTLSFDPLLLTTIKYMIPISEEASNVFKSDEFFHPWSKVIYSKMNGTELLKMNVVVLSDIFDKINHLPQNMEVENTFVWFRSLLTLSTITSLLGRDNPWNKDRSLVVTFWQWEATVQYFVLGPVPWLTCPSGYKARTDLHQALLKCDFDSSAPSAPDVCGLIKTATQMQQEHNWSTSDMAAMMVAILLGAVSNTVPTAYWYLMHVFTKPSLVAELRKELEPLAVPGQQLPNGKREMLLNVRNLEERAPLLVAAFRENQRVINVGTINRMVQSDTVLTSSTDPTKSYLFKKGTALVASQMTSHGSAEHWGPDVDEFKPSRFLRTDPETGEERTFEAEAPAARGAFIPFGGGKHLCPGRNFASLENWATMIAFLLGFDITTPEGQPLVLPERALALPAHGIGSPVKGSDLSSSIRRRKGWENVVWKVAGLPDQKE